MYNTQKYLIKSYCNMVRFIDNVLLNDIEFDFLKNSMNNFVSNSVPVDSITIKENTYQNFYHRMMLDKNVDLLNYQNKLLNYIKKNFNLNVKIEAIWINKITNQYNINADFHTDESQFTMITFLNDNFLGGEYEYVDDNDVFVEIKPKKGVSIMQNPLLLHRVKNVIEGDRYTLICFLETETKNKKTLL